MYNVLIPSSEVPETKQEAEKPTNIVHCVRARMCVGLKLLLTVTIPAALCPEEAESALEATHFFTDDDTLQGKYSHTYSLK